MKPGARAWTAGAIAAPATLVAWALALTSLAAAAEVKVTPLVSDGHVFASIDAPGVYTGEASDAVKNGVAVSFSFAIELKRPSTLWFDRTLDEVALVTTVKFDNLTGTYLVSRLQQDKVVWSDRTDREDQARTWATQLERVPLEPRDPLEPNGEYYVQVKVRTSPKHSIPLWPWGHDDGSGRADFTFIR